MDDFLLSEFCVVRYFALLRADLSSRGIPLSVMSEGDCKPLIEGGGGTDPLGTVAL